MKEQLEQLYGEYMQLRDDSDDYLLKNKYQEKMHALDKIFESMQALDKIFESMPYGAVNPANI